MLCLCCYRYDNTALATHDKQILPAISALTLRELRETTDSYTIIGIDEGQFVSVRLGKIKLG